MSTVPHTILYTHPMVPVEWIRAHGLPAQRIWPGAPKSIPSVGVCPYTQAYVDEIGGGDGTTRAAVFTTTCDQMRRAIEQVEIPSFLFNVPATWQKDSALEQYMGEVQRLSRFLINLGGKIPSKTTLRDTMIIHDQERHTQRLVYSAPNSTVRIALIGSPINRDSQYIHEWLEDAGAGIVLDGTINGEGGLCRPFDPEKMLTQPFDELVEATFHSIVHIGRRPNTSFFTWLETRLTELNIHGLIFHRQLWCDLWHAEIPRVRELTQLPVLELETCEQSRGGLERQRTRIMAFLEALL